MDNLSLLATLRELECELHQPEYRRNQERLAQLLAPDFKEFGRSGATYTRDHELMSLPSDPEPPQIHAQVISRKEFPQWWAVPTLQRLQSLH